MRPKMVSASSISTDSRSGFDKEMKMVGQNAVGDDTHSMKRLQLAHQSDKMLLFPFLQNELPIHHTGDAVVVTFPLPTNASLSHGGWMD